DDGVTYVANRRALIAVDTASSPARQKVFSLEGGASGMHLVGNRLYTVGTAGGFQIFDVTDRMNPVRLYGPQVGGSFDRLIRVSGTRAYITSLTGGLRVVDVTNPAAPVQMGSTTLGDPRGMEVVGTTVYVANGSDGLAIVDASNGNSPSVVGSYDPGATTSDVTVIGTLAVIANSGSSLIIDVTNPAAPVPIGDALESSDVAQRVGGYVLMESGALLDIADPSDVQTVGTIDFSSQPWLARAGGNRVAAVVGVNLIDVVNVETPASPSVTHTLPTIPGMISASLKGNRLFVTYDEPEDGVAIFDLATFASPRPLKLLPYSSALRTYACNESLALVETYNSVGPVRTDALTSAASLGSSPDAADCHGTLAVVLESSPRLYDLSGAGAPTSTNVGSLANGEDALDVDMDATRIYIAIDDSGAADGGFAAAAITGNRAELVYKRGLTDDPTSVAGSGNRAAVLFGDDVLLYDVPSDIGLDLRGTHALTVVDTIAAADGALVAVRTSTALQLYDADQPQAAPLGSVSLAYGAVKLASAGQLVFAVVATPAPERVVVVDVSAPATPNPVGAYQATGITAIAATGSRLLVARGGIVDVVDVSNPASPSKVGEYDSDVTSVTLMRASENLFVVRAPGGAEVVDMTNAGAPSRVGTVNNSNSTPLDMDLDGTALTLGSGFGIDLWDLQTPSSPGHLGRHQGAIQNVARVGNLVAALELAYMEGNWAYHGILVDVSFPTAPAQVASFDVPLIPTTLVEASGMLWFGTTTGLRVFPMARDAVRFDDLRTIAGLGTTVTYTATFTDLDSNRGERAQCVVTSGTCEVTGFDPVAHTVGVSWMVGAIAGQADIALIVGNDQWWAAAYDFITVQ
ncbi:MAG TPA: hypothetical protein VLC93_09870, partial [Myxococcota bacterium]|nr:hypothetical protein [Myxococcota bacterium]